MGRFRTPPFNNNRTPTRLPWVLSVIGGNDVVVGSLYVVAAIICRGLVRPPDKSAKSKINFLISQPKHMLWVLKRTVSMRQMLKLTDKKINYLTLKILTICTSVKLVGCPSSMI